MIQRIQTIYFFIAAVLLFVFAFFTDFNLLELVNKTINLFIPAIASVVVAFFSVVIILLFKNRNFQSKLSAFLILLVIAIIAYFIYSFGIKLFYKEWTFYLLPAAMLSIFLGKQNVEKDEKLIRSVDRLR
ncbi:MAG: DUF4293 family protein [Chitinophagales bacterium]